MAVQYEIPENWILYDVQAIVNELTEAKAAVMSLTAIPYQRAWADSLQALELKREIAGTSRIEGADFTERELDEALEGATPEEQLTRSQRQARAAINTYRWIASLPPDLPINQDLIKEVHLRIVTGCDDDHCAPGRLRGPGENVGFGRPTHRGAEGGRECQQAFGQLCDALNHQFRAHDPLIQALALHYHMGAMHPFQDGNGRTARAVEALILQRSHLKDTLFIAMSNYYYDEKTKYLQTLASVRTLDFDLTPFLRFALTGIASQCKRLLNEIRIHVQRTIFRDVMWRMYAKLKSTRKRAMGARQCHVLDKLIDVGGPIEYMSFYDDFMERHYRTLNVPSKAYVRDLNSLGAIRAITINRRESEYFIAVRLDWATEITETAFYQEIHRLPTAKTRLIIAPD
jgi:Fic family protein